MQRLASRLRWIAGLGALAAITLGAAAALAGSTPDPDIHDSVYGKSGGLRYAKDTGPFDLAHSGYADVNVGCGADGRHTVGGGFSTQGPPASKRVVLSSEPLDYYDPDLDADDGWSAAATASAAGSLSAYSICGTFTPRYRFISVPSQSGAVRTAKLSCGGNAWHVVSGGALIAPSASFINSSYPFDGGDKDKRPDDGWKVRVYDTGGGNGGFNLNAICVKQPVSYSSTRGKFKAHKQVKRQLACAHAGHAVGAGVKISGKAKQARSIAGYPYDGPDPDQSFDDGFKTAAVNLAGSKKTVSSTLICLD